MKKQNQISVPAIFWFTLSLAIGTFHLASAQEDLGLRVHQLFEQRCYKCHGQPGERVGGGLDYILDFDRLRTSPLVDLANAEKSVLYDLVSTDYMPLRDTPLSAPEKDLILTWLKAGAPSPSLAPGPAAPDFLNDDQVQNLVDEDLHLQPSSHRGLL